MGALEMQGRSGRDQGNLAVKEALGAMLQAWGSPFRWGSAPHKRLCCAAFYTAVPRWPDKHLTVPASCPLLCPSLWGSTLHSRVCDAAFHSAGPSWPGKHLIAPQL